MSSASGTSRRSHTKSRKGCKTCKKRHIRCDETFPQCRNCTKHQVRCDYMDTASQDDMPSTQQAPGALSTPEIESAIAPWQESGVASLGSISMDLHASLDYSSDDMRLLYHIFRAGQSAESREFTVWTNTFTQGLAAARSHLFLMHAGFAFTAFSLAFESGSHEAKGLAYHYGGVALRGLQDAISNFSKENADAVLLASRLLAWQANDWRSWTSLTSGIRTVVNSMQEFREESTIPHIIDQEDAAIPQSFPDPQRNPITDDFYGSYITTMQSCLLAIDNLTPYLAGRAAEGNFIDQLRDYVRRLLGVRPAYSPEEQFNHLYALRKWLFYVPAILLRSQDKDFLTLVVIAYFYAVALRMDSLFPNVAPTLLSGLAATPLQEIFDAFDRQSALHPGDASLQVQASLLSFPRQASASYHAQQQERKRSIEVGMNEAGFEGFREQLAYSIEGQGLSGHRSPGFGPAPPAREMSRTSSTGQAYLEVPTLASDQPTAAEAMYHGTQILSGLNISHEPEDMGYGDMDLPGGRQGQRSTPSVPSQHYGPYHPSPTPPSSQSGNR